MNIKDIAQHCGVAVSTVSRVLNNHPDVSEETRQKVAAVMEQYHYIPNNSARNLVRTTSDSIGLLVKGINNPFFARLIKVIELEVAKRGFTLELHHMDSFEDELRAAAVLATERRLRGILFLGGRFNYTEEELLLLPVPFVMCTYTNSFGTLEPGSYSSVAIDDTKAAKLAVNKLCELGHRRIALLCDDIHDASISELRTRGYREALLENGIEYDESLVIMTRSYSDLAAIYGAVAGAVDAGAEFTAIFAIADLMAIAAIKALHDRGRRVPDDCSIIAIDGLDLSEYTLPTLTTLVQPVEEMGLACAKVIIERILGQSPHRHIAFETTLRAGGSVLPPRA